MRKWREIDVCYRIVATCVAEGVIWMRVMEKRRYFDVPEEGMNVFWAWKRRYCIDWAYIDEAC